jgi:signal transduction histidine kinase
MSKYKEEVALAIVRARRELNDALYELEKMPGVCQNSVTFTAHALNNFLSVAGGAVELLSAALADHPNPKVHFLLQGLQHGTRLMTQTVSQLVSDSADYDLRLEAVDLSVMLSNFCNAYQKQLADQKQISILCESTRDIPPIRTDRAAVSVVFDNLFSNAVKYSPHGKSILVKASIEGEEFVCSICDQGPGLSREDQAKLFQRGARLTPRPTGGEPSTGYGLAVAKEFIDQLGGAIWCESELGQGCCFSIRLPVHRKEEHEPGPGQKPQKK